MNEQDIQAITLVVAMLIGLALVLAPFLLFFIYVFYQNSRRKGIREKLLATQQQLVASREWLPVRYASTSRFKKLFKIFPWEAAGILVMAPASAIFLGETMSGTPLRLEFAPDTAALTWLGKSPWPNGAVSWFVFSMRNEKYYFSSETGALIFGSHKSTRAVYDEASKIFAAQVQPAV
jgi:hypothetical protein